MYVNKHFSPVNPFYANQIIRPAREPTRVEGKFFPLQHPESSNVAHITSYLMRK